MSFAEVGGTGLSRGIFGGADLGGCFSELTLEVAFIGRFAGGTAVLDMGDAGVPAGLFDCTLAAASSEMGLISAGFDDPGGFASAPAEVWSGFELAAGLAAACGDGEAGSFDASDGTFCSVFTIPGPGFGDSTGFGDDLPATA